MEPVSTDKASPSAALTKSFTEGHVLISTIVSFKWEPKSWPSIFKKWVLLWSLLCYFCHCPEFRGGGQNVSLPRTWRRLAELWLYLYFYFYYYFIFQAIIMIQIATKPWLTLFCDQIRLRRNRIWQEEILAGQEQVETAKHTYIWTSNTSFLLALRTWPGLQRSSALTLTREPSHRATYGDITGLPGVLTLC